MSQFTQLLETLQNVDAEQAETLAKSVQTAQDDNKIQAAATKGTETAAATDIGSGKTAEELAAEETAAAAAAAAAGENKDTPLTKSITDSNGEEMVDATEILETLQKSVNSTNESLNAFMPTMIRMMKRMGETIVTQGDMIKSLQHSQASAGALGAGRKSQVVIMAKSQAGTEAITTEATTAASEGLTAGELMIKSNVAYNEGKINGVQLGMVDLALRNNQMPPTDILSAVFGHKL